MADIATSLPEVDYLFGTHDEEVMRLGLQHRVWRPRASDAWRRAGFTVGQTLLDVGSGPGYASLDLAEIVGATGHIHALDRSARFLDILQHTATGRGLANVSTHLVDLDRDPLPNVQADGAWVRWVFAFLRNPRALLEQIANRLQPGATLVIHEYFDYRTFRTVDRSSTHQKFVEAVMKAWRADGGEPDIALDLLGWIEELGLTIESTKTIVDVISPKDYAWHWPKSFIDIGLRRLVSIGELSEERAGNIRSEFASYESKPHARMVTPALLEIVARK
jgi:ubiquinone/menaquinone biosynthesis C-methylase UbiE